MIVLLCSWVKTRAEGPNATERHGDYRFKLAKVPRAERAVGPHSFAFPINVQQVIFSNVRGESDWKVVCCVDVRSWRSPL